jgi:hypothetical protein
MLPVFLMGVWAMSVRPLRKAFGEKLGIACGTIILAASCTCRVWFDGGVGLLVAAAGAGVGISIVQALAPGFIKRNFAENAGRAIGIDALPHTALATAGITTENGVAVAVTFWTSVSNIVAAGDCGAFPLALYVGRRVLKAWRNAQQQRSLTARNMLGCNEVIGTVPYFWSDQFDLTLQVALLADGAPRTVRRNTDTGLHSFRSRCQ